MSSQRTPTMNLSLTRGEAVRLHEEIGDIPRSHAGPKLQWLYRQLDDMVSIEWDEKTMRGRKKRMHAL